MEERKYAFSWDLLGNLEVGRPNLGNSTRVEIYRLMQFTLRDIIEARFGTEEADKVFYEAGKKAGIAFSEHFLAGNNDVGDFVKKLQSVLKEMKIGVLRVESMTDGAEKIILTVDEDLDCAGLPEMDYEICVYDEGFIAGILENFSGKQYIVKEIDCWCTGDRTCRFTADRAAD
ncbi:MAG: 4-vinyl reductase [Synergistaceae bacterium]|jgi:predicted hydrocarbon binding protein|nr:4-vinyl reductase [Synergistaceae bacterium]